MGHLLSTLLGSPVLGTLSLTVPLLIAEGSTLGFSPRSHHRERACHPADGKCSLFLWWLFHTARLLSGPQQLWDMNSKRALYYTLKSGWFGRIKWGRRKNIQASHPLKYSQLTLITGLATQKLPEVFGCMSVCINPFFDSLDVSSSTTQFPLCLD